MKIVMIDTILKSLPYMKAIQKEHINSYDETSIIVALSISFNEIYKNVKKAIDLNKTGDIYGINNVEERLDKLKEAIDDYIKYFVELQLQYETIEQEDKIWKYKRLLEKFIFKELSELLPFLSW